MYLTVFTKENGHLHQNDVNLGPSSYHGCTHFILRFNSRLFLVFFDICLSVFIENGHQYQNDVILGSLDNTVVLISFLASI